MEEEVAVGAGRVPGGEVVGEVELEVVHRARVHVLDVVLVRHADERGELCELHALARDDGKPGRRGLELASADLACKGRMRMTLTRFGGVKVRNQTATEPESHVARGQVPQPGSGKGHSIALDAGSIGDRRLEFEVGKSRSKEGNQNTK